MNVQPTSSGIGAAVRRTEDPRFLRGKGRYTDDITLSGQTYLHILRSPHAHATIKGIDLAAAKAAPGWSRFTLPLTSPSSAACPAAG